MMGKKAIGVIFVSALCALLFSCDSLPLKDASDYTNDAVQNVKIGDKVKIYFTTNSCCHYCSPSKKELNHLKYIGEETVIESPSDCDGCSSTQAVIFQATGSGTDTITGKVISRGEDCSDSLGDFDSYVIHVK